MKPLGFHWIIKLLLLFQLRPGTGTHHDMHLSFQDGGTALMKASESERLECVKVLLDRGADVNMQDKVSAAYKNIHVAMFQK